ncbi:MAG: thiamine-phosphate kinase [Verrucomicrobiales bacterium]|nr:thiamine-phosphate kinase [Verrucomicrobiales bacterium]
MNELELIRRLTRDLPANHSVVVGPGDDCAVLEPGLDDRWLLFKTDAVVEGVHFTADTEPARIGHKALARCLSDIAAMGGRPDSAVVTVAAPPTCDPGRIEAIYGGMAATARRFEVAIVGGETTSTTGPLLLSVALIGSVQKTRCVRRAGAVSGDAVFVSGELGGSLAGRHLDFEPRIEEATWLVGHFRPHAMIDVSDGLATDLRHLLEASSVGAELLQEALPVSRAARQRAREGTGKPPVEAALTDGEDFELLFTVPGADAVPLLDGWKARFPELRLSCIGRITETPGLTLRDRRGTRPLDLHGYAHFTKPG